MSRCVGARTWGKGASLGSSLWGGGEEASVPGGLLEEGCVPVQPRRAGRGRGIRSTLVPGLSHRNPVLTNQAVLEPGSAGVSLVWGACPGFPGTGEV